MTNVKLIKNFKNCLIISIATVFFTACSPTSKESYLEKFDEFVTHVSENYSSYTEKDWKRASKKYEKFSGEWYSKFENEYTLKEEIKIKAYQAKWYYYRNLNNVTSTALQLLESLDIKGIKKQVQYYIDNNMQNDLQKFYEDATKAGKDAEDALSKVLDELKIKVDELKK